MRLADQVFVLVFGADRDAVADGGVEAAGEATFLELEGLCGRRGEQGCGDGRGQRGAGQQATNGIGGFH